MKIKLQHEWLDMEADYNGADGTLNHVTDLETEKKMILESYQEGIGYVIEKNANLGYVTMDVCNASYLRIREADLFIPRYLFIKNDN